MTGHPPRRLYRNPPLLEATIEFQFAPGRPWNSDYFGLIRSELKEFPRSETISEASFVVAPDRIGVAPAGEMKRYWREDRGMVVTVRPDLIAVSVLPPNLSDEHRWETLRDVAFTTLKLYQRVARPGPFRQTGVRYINAVTVEPAAFRLSNYAAAESGFVPPVLMEERQPFSQRLERTTQTTERYHLREVITLAAQPTGQSEGRLILDVDQIATWNKSAEVQNVRTVLEKMHDAVHAVFTKLLRAEILETFNPYNRSSEPH
jgi:uncharacterized protein (TIGR04255 family)